MLQIADFGLAHVKSLDEQLDGADMLGVCGTQYYMAPEVLQGQPYGTKADVYSYGVLLFEMAAGKFTYDAATMGKDMSQRSYDKAVISGQRPTIPADVAEKPLGRLILRCWHSEQEQRPSVDEIVYQDLADMEVLQQQQDELVLEDLPEKAQQLFHEKTQKLLALQAELNEQRQKNETLLVQLQRSEYEATILRSHINGKMRQQHHHRREESGANERTRTTKSGAGSSRGEHKRRQRARSRQFTGPSSPDTIINSRSKYRTRRDKSRQSVAVPNRRDKSRQSVAIPNRGSRSRHRRNKSLS